ncbi:MAG: hypothetical protein WA542_03385 [Candidatus Acidiferrum sp.]
MMITCLRARAFKLASGALRSGCVVSIGKSRFNLERGNPSPDGRGSNEHAQAIRKKALIVKS